ADDAVVHPTGASVPAARAVAERLGKVSGRDFITAIALGNDLSTRLALALKGSVVTTGWVNPSVFGVFGGVAAAGKLLGLTEEQMAHAFCCGFYQAGGSIEVAFGTGSTIRAIRDAFTGKTAVLSALLASQGLTGVETSLDGPFGLYNLYFKGAYDAEAITQGLGKLFHGTWVSFKPWPCCRGTHSCVDATLSLVKERNLLPGDVEGVTVTVGEHGRALCTPLEERRRPKLSIDAKHSIPFTVALAIARRNIVLADFKGERLADPEILRLAQKVDWKFNPEFAIRGIEPGMVEIRLKGGVAYSKKVDFAYGNPKNPISPDDLVAKFRDCAAYAVNPLAPTVLEEVIQGVSNLESAADMGQIVEPLAREGALQR
ncbi:MAG: MmgE/PrpD family protein, partial [Chloroflexota bacterium]|nr:MmgE/PrpD family protein [Chloroflexota bacterium]